MMPSAFDEAGIRMVDSIREIFDLADFEFESVDFDLIKYNSSQELAGAIRNGKCLVADVAREYINRATKGGSHTMLATGIKYKDGYAKIQLRNPFAANRNEQGKVRKKNFNSAYFMITFFSNMFKL